MGGRFAQEGGEDTHWIVSQEGAVGGVQSVHRGTAEGEEFYGQGQVPEQVDLESEGRAEDPTHQ